MGLAHFLIDLRSRLMRHSLHPLIKCPRRDQLVCAARALSAPGFGTEPVTTTGWSSCLTQPPLCSTCSCVQWSRQETADDLRRTLMSVGTDQSAEHNAMRGEGEAEKGPRIDFRRGSDRRV